MSTHEITAHAAPDPETINAISDGLNAYNAAASGVTLTPEPLWLVSRDNEGRVTGGLKARIAWGWIGIEWLWVDAASRGSGLGTALLARAEAIARDRGCAGAFLDTFSFQAPGFYTRQGYTEFGRLDGIPAGQARIHFAKRF